MGLSQILEVRRRVSPEDLAEARDRLDITTLSRQSSGLEYILVETSVGIGYRIYEDGLIILEKAFSNLESDLSRSVLTTTRSCQKPVVDFQQRRARAERVGQHQNNFALYRHRARRYR